MEKMGFEHKVSWCALRAMIQEQQDYMLGLACREGREAAAFTGWLACMVFIFLDMNTIYKACMSEGRQMEVEGRLGEGKRREKKRKEKKGRRKNKK
jgi:hypothetical protein